MNVSCPKCGERFRISDDTPAGKRLKCPECSAVFSLDNDDEPEMRKSSKARSRDRDERDEGDDDLRSGSAASRRDKSRPRDRDEDDVDEDEDRPARRKKKKKSKAVLIWCLAGGGVLLVGGIVLALVLLLGGTTHDSATRESMAIMEDWTAILETVKDPESAKAAVPRLERIAERFESLQKRAKDLPTPKPEELDALRKKYEARTKALSERWLTALAAANRNSRNEPIFREAMRKIDRAQMGKK